MADNKSIADELLKLHELKEKGVITEEEFNEQKARLLQRSKDQSTAQPSHVGTERVESQPPVEQPTVIVTQTKAPGSSGLLGCLGGGVVAVVVVVVLLAIGGYFWFSSHKGADDEATSSSNQQHETVAITSAQLAAAYSENEVAAKQTYGDKTLDVTGTITGINLDLFDNPVIDLGGVDEFLSVQASFDKSYNARIGALSKGQQITVRCTSLDSVLTTPMLKDCSLPSRDETVNPPETSQTPPEAAPNEQSSQPEPSTEQPQPENADTAAPLQPETENPPQPQEATSPTTGATATAENPQTTVCTTDSQPSFDCTKAVSPAARTICSSPALREADCNLSLAFGVAAARADAAGLTESLRIDERSWIKQRDQACAMRSDYENCLLEWTQSRTDELES